MKFKIDDIVAVHGDETSPARVTDIHADGRHSLWWINEASPSIHRWNEDELSLIARPKPDNINSPDHYTKHPSGIQPIILTRHMNFCLGSAVKYIMRAGLKDGNDAEQDLRKAIALIEEEISVRKNQPSFLAGKDHG